jgi:ABC-type lipoprotein export system ATPase subunit
METAPLLEVRDVSKVYAATTGGPETRVLRGVNLSLSAGQSLAIMGPSGAGKSTLLNLIGGLDKPTSGAIYLEGQDLASLSEDELAAVRNRRLGFVFQLHHLLPQCTAIENVLIPTLARDSAKADDVDRATDLLRRVGLGDRAHHFPGQLSGGERQRAAVARALINRPSLLLADEPTGSLDAASAEAVAHLLTDLNRVEGVSVLVITHAPEIAARFGRTLRLDDGVLAEAPVLSNAQ